MISAILEVFAGLRKLHSNEAIRGISWGKISFDPNIILSNNKRNGCDEEEYIYQRLCRERTDGESSCVLYMEVAFELWTESRIYFVCK